MRNRAKPNSALRHSAFIIHNSALKMKATYSQRLIKLADLNHHQTFFAGRCSEYFLESSVLLVLHGIDFKFPIFAGDIVTFESKVIAVGRSTLTVYTKMYRSREPEKIAADGFATFSYLDENHHSRPHGITLEPETDEERFLQQQALEVMEDSKRRAKAMNGFGKKL